MGHDNREDKDRYVPGSGEWESEPSSVEDDILAGLAWDHTTFLIEEFRSVIADLGMRGGRKVTAEESGLHNHSEEIAIEQSRREELAGEDSVTAMGLARAGVLYGCPMCRYIVEQLAEMDQSMAAKLEQIKVEEERA
jgi:hypothetical protein